MNLFRTAHRYLRNCARQCSYPLRYCYRLVRGLRIDLWRIKGEERNTHLPLSVLCALSSQEKSLMIRLMFGTAFREDYLGRVWRWKAPQVARKAGVEYSIFLSEGETLWFGSETEKGSYIIPAWVKGDIEVPLKPDVLRSRSVRSDLKKVRDHRLTLEITQDPTRYEWFYHEMHIPYIKQIRGDAAYIEPFSQIKRRLRDCELFLVKKKMKRSI